MLYSKRSLNNARILEDKIYMRSHFTLDGIRWNRLSKFPNLSKFSNIEGKECRSCWNWGNSLISIAGSWYRWCKCYMTVHSFCTCCFISKSLVSIWYRGLARMKPHNYHNILHRMKHNYYCLSKIRLHSLNIHYYYMRGIFQGKPRTLQMD